MPGLDKSAGWILQPRAVCSYAVPMETIILQHIKLKIIKWESNWSVDRRILTGIAGPLNQA